MSSPEGMTATEGWNIQLQGMIRAAIGLLERVETSVGKSLPPDLRDEISNFVDSDGKVAALFEAEIAALFTEEQAMRSSYEVEEKFRAQLSSWSDATFGDIEARGPVGPLRHLALEAEEAAKKYEAGDQPGFMVELADCQMIWWDALRRARVKDPEVLAACHLKLEVVKRRNYPKPTGDEPAQHIRPMVLHCPQCHTQHIDKLEASGIDWSKRPHRKHQCANCGNVWKPFDFHTVGVEEVTTP